MKIHSTVQDTMTAVCLLVEDDVVTRRIISNFLSSCSYEVIEASNGRIALDILESPQGEVVDIILTDNKMPEVRHAHKFRQQTFSLTKT